ncbi:MAG: hypothetical protein IPM81_11905 [Saprospirales bacterium]|nr:hypothetical protein [Saprospirales bacterium]
MAWVAGGVGHGEGGNCRRRRPAVCRLERRIAPFILKRPFAAVHGRFQPGLAAVAVDWPVSLMVADRGRIFSVTLTLPVAVQPLASVTVKVWAPAASRTASGLVSSLSQRYWYGAGAAYAQGLRFAVGTAGGGRHLPWRYC